MHWNRGCRGAPAAVHWMGKKLSLILLLVYRWVHWSDFEIFCNGHLTYCRIGTRNEADRIDLRIGNCILPVNFNTRLGGQKHEAALCRRRRTGLPFCDAAWPSSYTLTGQ